MARQRKADTDIDLENKLDANRTLVRLRHRCGIRTELNELEPEIVRTHNAEIQARKPKKQLTAAQAGRALNG